MAMKFMLLPALRLFGAGKWLAIARRNRRRFEACQLATAELRRVPI